jgi:myo-inositol-1(or 4)-monophosphatase
MSEYLDTAISLAKSSGEIMRANFGLSMKKDWKEDHSPVTETDLAINDLVLKEIKKRYPDHSILAEEDSDFSDAHEYVWICDPVDGTHNFAHGIPTATFALALTHRGETVLSVVYDPFMDRLYQAEKGQGAFLNTERIRVGASSTLKRTVAGLGKLNGVRPFMPVLNNLREHGVRSITGLSIHYMCALVAAGEFSLTLFGGTSPHDITASALLVEEAGGVATDLFGKKPGRWDRDIEGLIVTNQALHPEILAILDVS